MLDTFIIEELKRRERERLQRERQRPQIEIPAPRDEREPVEDHRSDREEVPGNAVLHIDL